MYKEVHTGTFRLYLKFVNFFRFFQVMPGRRSTKSSNPLKKQPPPPPPPQIFQSPLLRLVDEQVVLLEFSNIFSLQAALQRPHEEYEMGKLKGPLKGVNFPIQPFYTDWAAASTGSNHHPAGGLSDAERLVFEMVVGTWGAGSGTAGANVNIDQLVDAHEGNPPTINSESLLEDTLSQLNVNSPAAEEFAGEAESLGDKSRRRRSTSSVVSQISTPPMSVTAPQPQPLPLLPSPPKYKYLIACLSKDSSTILHEWAHAQYHLDSSYKSLCLDIYHNKLSPQLKLAIEKELRLRSYHPTMYADEFQAYVVETPVEFGKKWIAELKEFHRQLRKHLSPIPKDFKNKIDHSGAVFSRQPSC